LPDAPGNHGAPKRGWGAPYGFDDIEQVIFPPYWINMIHK
jgi:hypothetical protein